MIYIFKLKLRIENKENKKLEFGGFMIKEQLTQIKLSASSELDRAQTLDEIETVRVRYLGKKGELTAVLSQMGKLSSEERPVIGQSANEIRNFIENGIKIKKDELSAKALEDKLSAEKLDVTLPGKRIRIGKKHPLSIVLDEIKEAFISRIQYCRRS